MSIRQENYDAKPPSVTHSSARLMEYLEELKGSPERKFATADNVRNNEFATVDVVNHQSQQEDLPQPLEQLMDAPYCNGSTNYWTKQ